MNNDHTYAAITDRLASVQDSFGETHPIIPASEIFARAHRRRVRRRLIAGSTGVLAMAGGAAVAVAALLPAGSPGRDQPAYSAHAQLAAWTVVKQADGTIVVKIREFRDPAGLQRKLRADGVPASVHFGTLRTGEPLQNLVHFNGNPCEEYSGGESQAPNVVTGGSPFTVGMFLHPSAIPAGAGVQFVSTSNAGYQHGPQHLGLVEWLVQASPQCTGS